MYLVEYPEGGAKGAADGDVRRAAHQSRSMIVVAYLHNLIIFACQQSEFGSDA